MTDPRDYKLDISGRQPSSPPTAPTNPRPYLSVLFACCSVYQRVYRQPGRAEYVARCPRCLRTVHFRVAPDGTTERTFIVR